MNITKEAADIMNKALVASWQIVNGRTFLYFSENEDTLLGLKHVIRLHFAYTHTPPAISMFYVRADCTGIRRGSSFK